MKIILLDNLNCTLLDNLLSENVLYRPDLMNKSDEILLATLVGNHIDAIVCSAPLSRSVLHAWADARPSLCYIVTVDACADTAPLQPAQAPAQDGAGHARLARLSISGNAQAAAYTAAFEALERESTRAIAPDLPVMRPSLQVPRQPVVMLGGGIVNLISAYALQKAGHAIRIIDGGPDPRTAQPWVAYGCSRGGDDARMFTLSEMDNYNDRQASPQMNTLFQRSAADLGWNVHWKDTLSASEKNWIKQFESIPVWLANRYNDDIFSFNHESLALWEEWKSEDPALFEGSVLREDILRLYSDPDHYAAAVKRQAGIGATKRLLTPEQIIAEQPGLAQAARHGRLAGGILTVGFTINIHKFMHRLLDRLEQAGAVCEWNQRATNLLFDEQGKVKGIRTANMVVQARHYVISPGAYGDAILSGTRAQGKIHGVLGAWLRLPHTGPQITHSLKLARKGHITEDANVTIVTDVDGSPLLVIGSGYGHTGIDPRNIDQAQLHQIYQGLVDTAQEYFPEAYEAALAQGSLESHFKYCVRPWTSTSLGLFDIQATSGDGRCVVTGGHNTGGFAQSPSVAQAVVAALEGQFHPMHAAYHPQRAESFLHSPSPETAQPRRQAEPALAS